MQSESLDDPTGLPTKLVERLERHGPPQAVVFDMDGLIFNSEDLYDVACGKLLERRGKTFTREIKLQIMGKKAPLALQLLCELTEIQEPLEPIRDEIESYFVSAVEQSLDTMPGFESLLEQLEDAGVRKAIATSSSRSLADVMLTRFDLHARFEFVLTGDDVEHGKPHPEIYLSACERLSIQPVATAVLEDSHTGATAALAAGAMTIAVPNEHTQDCDFSDVDLIANTLADPRLKQVLTG